MKGGNGAARGRSPAELACPASTAKGETIVLGHGSGGRLTADLIRRLFLPAFSNPTLDRLNDAAELGISGARIVLTTDAFVASPIRFPGGDLGSIAVNGTINDLAVVGAEPVALSAAFILEEGFAIAELERVVASMRAAALDAGVQIVAADTKVVERGKGDGLFITTSGVGVLAAGVELGPERARPSDAIIVSGPIGDHGIAVMAAREGLSLTTSVESDSAALNGLVAAMLASGGAIRCMRDPTRGGLATVANELARASGVEFVLDEEVIPVREAVRAACEILGLDPLYVACEGRLVAVVADSGCERVLAAMRAHRHGRDARKIGVVAAASREARVVVRTAFGTTRVVDVLPGSQLPRIC
jgi:hydrogenase expression/formation protein HypE